MTEEDTFTALARIPYKDMFDIWWDYDDLEGWASAPIFEEHGWNIVDFFKMFEADAHARGQRLNETIVIKAEETVWELINHT